MTMRIGLLTPRLLERPTGIVNYSMNLAVNLRDLGADVEVVILNRSTGPRPAWFDGFEVINLAVRAGSLGLPLWARLQTVARTSGIDVVHATGNVAPFVGPSHGVRRVVTVHDVGALVRPRDRSLRDRIAHAALIPPLRWTANAILTDSEASADDLTQFAGVPRSRIRVIPLGTSWPAEATPRDPASDPRLSLPGPYFVAIGDVAAHKNLLGVLGAFDSLRTRLPHGRLVIVGQLAHGGSEVEARARSMGEAVILTGFVCDQTRDALYRGALALVFASLHEGFGLPVLEAMARGTPVITSNCSSLPEVAGDAALLVDPLSPDQIAGAMWRVASDAELASSLRGRGLERARKFTWTRTAQLTLDEYQAVCSADPGVAASPSLSLTPATSLPAAWLRAGLSILPAGPR